MSVVPPQRRAAQPAVDVFSTEFVIREPLGGLEALGSGGIAGLAGLASLLMPDLQPRNLNDLFAQIPGFADAVPVRPTAAEIAAATTQAVNNNANGEVCAICQDDIIIGCQTRQINHCHHNFHRGCIDTWFAQNVHCPVCRHDIRDVVTVPAPAASERQVEDDHNDAEEDDDDDIDGNTVD